MRPGLCRGAPYHTYVFRPSEPSAIPGTCANRNAAGNERICVYTALFGGYDELRPPAYKPPGLDFICFSDRPLAAPGLGRPPRRFSYRLAGDEEPAAQDVAVRKVLRIRFLPLPRLECRLARRPSHLYWRWLRGQPFVAWRHPQRSSAFDELEVLLASSRADPSGIIDQYVLFAEQGVPERADDRSEFPLAGSPRPPSPGLMQRVGTPDQPSELAGSAGLAYLMWKTGIQPAVLPDHLGTSRDNEYTRKFAHKTSRRTTLSPTQRLGSNA